MHLSVIDRAAGENMPEHIQQGSQPFCDHFDENFGPFSSNSAVHSSGEQQCQHQ